MNGLEGVGLFSGVGGMELALRSAGITTKALCEIDPSARTVLARRFPGIPVFDDVRKVTGDRLRDLGLDPARTVVTAGFPCQDLSVAGRRAGLDHGERSGLFWEIHRILGEFPAAWVLLENVAGLLSAVCPCRGDGLCVARGLAVRCPGELHTVPGGACDGQCIARHGGAMGAVLGALGERGYGFAYRVLDAQHFGVPQRRRRVFIVGRRPGGPGLTAPAQVLLEPEGGGGDPAPRATPWPVPAGRAAAGVDRPRLVGALTTRAGNTQDDQQSTQLVYGTGSVSSPGLASTLGTQSGGGRTTDIENRGALVVSALTSNMAGAGGGRRRQHSPGGTPHLAATLNCGGNDGGFRTEPGEHLVVVRQGPACGGERPVPGDVDSGGGVSPTLNAGENHSDVRATALVTTVLGDVTHTLTAEGADASEDGSGRGQPIIAFSHTAGMDHQASTDVAPTVLAGNDRMPAVGSPTVVRRLTPLECERLQGFPDGWTEGLPDSARYRAMGNAVAVPVVAWIAQRLVAVEARAESDADGAAA